MLEQIELPLLYVVRDRYKTVAEEMRARIPGARVHVFGEAGHALFVDEPDQFNRILSDFLDSIQNR
ncbi:alpha/beta fold hydrolase [candidate division KSB1 bacterium]